MKKIIYITLLACLFTSCELVDVVDVEPQDVLTEENAIRNQKTAELALAGIYAEMRSVTGSYMEVVFQLGIGAQPGGLFGGTTSDYYINSINPQDGGITSMYSNMYELINRANYLIANLQQLNDDLFTDNAKTEIMAEARFMRGLDHFYLLRLYGQFWDLNSKYGIVIKDSPSRSAKVEPRSTVQESYDFILKDINFAIQNLPADKPPIYANKYAAMGFKARILLYMGRYQDAAKIAKKVIDNSPFTLEDSFSAIFEKKLQSSEVMFVKYYDNDEFGQSALVWLDIEPSDQYIQIANNHGDTRIDFVIYEHPAYGRLDGKFTGYLVDGNLGGDTNYYLRLAEVYLIYAEALARSNGTLTDADNSVDDVEDALNAIRNRAGLANSTADTQAEFITAIRMEKLLELAVENGEPWFDMVRYAAVDGLDLSTIKSTIQSKNQWILPIPYQSVNLSNGVVKQNPGY